MPACQSGQMRLHSFIHSKILLVMYYVQKNVNTGKDLEKNKVEEKTIQMAETKLNEVISKQKVKDSETKKVVGSKGEKRNDSIRA